MNSTTTKIAILGLLATLGACADAREHELGETPQGEPVATDQAPVAAVDPEQLAAAWCDDAGRAWAFFRNDDGVGMRGALVRVDGDAVELGDWTLDGARLTVWAGARLTHYVATATREGYTLDAASGGSRLAPCAAEEERPARRLSHVVGVWCAPTGATLAIRADGTVQETEGAGVTGEGYATFADGVLSLDVGERQTEAIALRTLDPIALDLRTEHSSQTFTPCR